MTEIIGGFVEKRRNGTPTGRKEAQRSRETERGELLAEMGWNLRYAGGRHRQAE